jgi:hypothetical protein
MRRWTAGLQPILQRWTANGFWIPARDLSLLHERARATGLVVPAGRLFSSDGLSDTTADASLEKARQAILSLRNSGEIVADQTRL